MTTLNLANTDIWSSAADLPSEFSAHASSGSQAASLIVGGARGSNLLNKTQLFNGTVWSQSSDLDTYIVYTAAVGLQNASLLFGGRASSTSTGSRTQTNKTKMFDGSTWSNHSATTLVSLQNHNGCGVQNAALSIGGGYHSSTTADSITQKFNGIVWSAGATGNQLSARQRMYMASCGSQNNVISFGGMGLGSTASSYNYYTEKFDGSAWAIVSNADLTQAKRYIAGCGSPTDALLVGGCGTSYAQTYDTTEKFNGLVWSSSSPTLSTKRFSHSAVGTSTGSLVCAGYNGVNDTDLKSCEKLGSHPILNINEGVTAGTQIASLSSPEAEMSFSLVSGENSDDNSSFSISGSNLVALINLDYETKTVHSIRVNASNGATSYQNVISIQVQDIAEGPVPVELTQSNSSVASNGKVVGVVSVDPRSTPITSNGSPLPVGSVLKNSSGQKYYKNGSGATDFVAIETIPPAEWNFAAEYNAIWEVLQSI